MHKIYYFVLLKHETMSDRYHFECVDISRGQFRLHDRRQFGISTRNGEGVTRNERRCSLILVSGPQYNRQIRIIGSFMDDEYLTFSLRLDEVQGLLSGLHQLIFAEHVIQHFQNFTPIQRRSSRPIRFWGRMRNAVFINNDWTYGRPAFWTPEGSETNKGTVAFYLPDRIEVPESEYNAYIQKLLGTQGFVHGTIESELRAFRPSQYNQWKLYIIFLAILSAGQGRVSDFPDQLLTASGDGIPFGNENKHLVYNRYQQEQEPPSSDSCSCNLVVMGLGFFAIIALIVVMQRSV